MTITPKNADGIPISLRPGSMFRHFILYEDGIKVEEFENGDDSFRFHMKCRLNRIPFISYKKRPHKEWIKFKDFKGEEVEKALKEGKFTL